MEDRIESLLRILRDSRGPVKGEVLASALGVSRQSVVGYVSLLRERGFRVVSTRDGYLLEGDDGVIRRVLAFKHTREEIAEELLSLVRAGARVVDVMVEHPVYGELRGRIDVSSEEEVLKFLSLLVGSGAVPLLELSGGIHLHTIEARDEATMERALESVRKFLVLEEVRR